VGATEAFPPFSSGPVLDDHVPFLRRGIPVAVIIHQPFPDTWHTTSDTPEYVSPSSLEEVGRVLVRLIWNG
jgi:glutaminyl-peptide cyclotransferase